MTFGWKIQGIRVAYLLQKIFFIEDNLSLVKIYGQRLEKEGFQVFVAPEATEGLRRVKEEKPDLVILDLILPGMSGFEVLRDLKQNPETKDIPVLILTVLEQKEDVDEAVRLGASGYLFKSETALDELVENVKKNLVK